MLQVLMQAGLTKVSFACLADHLAGCVLYVSVSVYIECGVNALTTLGLARARLLNSLMLLGLKTVILVP